MPFPFTMIFIFRYTFLSENASSSLFMLQLVKRKRAALKYASAELKSDREIVMEAVKQTGARALRLGRAEGRPGDRDGGRQAERGRCTTPS